MSGEDDVKIYAAKLTGRIIANEMARDAEARASVREYYEQQIKADRY